MAQIRGCCCRYATAHSGQKQQPMANGRRRDVKYSTQTAAAAAEEVNRSVGPPLMWSSGRTDGRTDGAALGIYLTGASVRPSTSPLRGGYSIEESPPFNQGVTTRWQGEITITHPQVAKSSVLISPHHLVVVTPRLNGPRATKEREENGAKIALCPPTDRPTMQTKPNRGRAATA